jgi:hypothetical protein
MLNLSANDSDDSVTKHWPVLLALSLGLSGCAEPPPPAQPVSAVSVVGTPFLIAFKVPACVATLAIAGPAAALQQLAAPNEDRLQPDIRPALDAGIDENCGPPYVVVPR